MWRSFSKYFSEAQREKYYQRKWRPSFLYAVLICIGLAVVSLGAFTLWHDTGLPVSVDSMSALSALSADRQALGEQLSGNQLNLNADVARAIPPPGFLENMRKRRTRTEAVNLAAKYRKMSDAGVSTFHGQNIGHSADGQKHSFEQQFKHPLSRDKLEDWRNPHCKTKDYTDVYESGQKATVIIIFCNEDHELLLRSIHSVLDRSPPELLEEIILVDDGSDVSYIKSDDANDLATLVGYVSKLPKVRLLRTGYRSGIVTARSLGIENVKSDIFIILDSHIEAESGWLEPLILPIVLDPKSVAMPHIDNIDKPSGMPQAGGIGCTLGIIWKLMEHAFVPELGISTPERINASPSDYVSSPTMAGGLFAANKKWFDSIGGYDKSLTGWGAENVEFSFRLWQCHGKLLCTECSRVAHMFGGGKRYSTPGNSYTLNRLRTAAAWMDDFGDIVWRLNGKPKKDPSWMNVTDVLQQRQKLHCHNFQWFMDNVWPESDVRNLPQDLPYLSPIMNIGTEGCIKSSSRGAANVGTGNCQTHSSSLFWFFNKSGRITLISNDETCLLPTMSNNREVGIKYDWCPQSQRTIETWIFDVIHHSTTAGINEPTDKSDLRHDIKKALGSNLKRIFKENYENGLDVIQIRARKFPTKCLTVDAATDLLELQKCDVMNLKQLWLVANYKVSEFWKEIHAPYET